MRSALIICVATVSLIGTIRVAAAQTAHELAWRAAATHHAELEISDPTLRSPLAQGLLNVVFESSTADKKATGRIGTSWRNAALDLKLSAPLAESGDTNLATLEGLSDGSTLDVGFTWRWWTPTTTMDQACAAVTVRAKIKKYICDEDNGEFFFQPDGDSKVPIAAQSDWKTPIFTGMRLMVGSREHKFVDAATLLDEEPVTKVGYSATGWGGAWYQKLGFMAISARWERSYKAARSAQVCVPVGADGALECRTREIGEPREKTKLVLGGEWRRYLGPNVGTALAISYDVGNDELGSLLSVYFLQSKDGLQGGVTMNIVRGEDDSGLKDTKTSAIVFIGAAFSLLP